MISLAFDLTAVANAMVVASLVASALTVLATVIDALNPHLHAH